MNNLILPPLLACSLAGLSGAAGPGAEPEPRPAPEDFGYRTPDEVWGDMELLRKELAPLQEEMGRLAASYLLNEGFADLESRRSELKDRLNLKKRRYCSFLRYMFNDLRQQEHMRASQQVLARRKSADLGAYMNRAILLERQYTESWEFCVKTLPTREDDQAFELARAAQARRRKARKTAAGGAAVVLAALALLGRRVLRRRRLQEPASPFSVSAPALPAPPSEPAPSPSLPGRESLPAAFSSAAAASAEALLGGRFALIRELGRGGLGLVFEAQDRSSGRAVAIKAVPEEICASPRESKAFLAQARLVATLDHPHIVKLQQVLEDGSRLFLILELAPGAPLGRLLEERGALPLHAARPIFEQAASALDYAHGSGVLHRELKPSNIFVTEQGAAKLADFALSYLAKTTSSRISGRAAWAPARMAPELELGQALKESDLYALAACLYEMLSGKPPFSGPDFLEQKRRMDFAPPSSLGLAAGLDPLFARALQADPTRRFQSASELAHALREIA